MQVAEAAALQINYILSGFKEIKDLVFSLGKGLTEIATSTGLDDFLAFVK
ncbi:MAG: hypothetical protein QE271_13595 [Bacteriovoracaceae bacterium]|nr:hypothetical protein [Bacteriovoracaceae bacterium]